MKFSARILIIFFLFLFSFFSAHLFPIQTVHAGVFDFNLEKYVDQKLAGQKEEKRSGKASVDIGNVRGFDLQATMTEITNMVISIHPDWNPKQTRAVPALAQIMTKMYEYPPASAMAYTYDLLHNAGLLTKPVYAQGIGFAGLSPLLPLWKASRDIAYAVLILVMLAIGFMVIFRMKIDPKTVISVQSAIPKIIFTLILITLSYPIAGFLIDVMYLSIMIVVEVMSKAVPANLPGGAGFMKETANQQQAFIQTGIVGWGNLFTSVFSFGLFPAFFQQFFLSSIPNAAGGILGGLGLGAIISNITLFGLAGGPALIAGLVAVPVIILLLIGLGLLFTFIRLTFLLMNAYIQIILTVLLGPIQLLKEAIPGQSAFGDWIKNLLANLIVFPTTVAVIYFSWIMTAVTWSGNLWGAPLIPTGGGGDVATGNPMAFFMGLGIIYLAPSLVASVKKVFGAKPMIPLSAGAPFAPLTGAVGTGMGAMSQFYYMKQVFGGGEGTLKGATAPFVSFFNKITGRK